MKTVVLFGDSNTWGYIPGTERERYPRDVRWPTRLAEALGDGYDVIAEGLSGRNATVESPVEEGRNGLPYLLPCLRSHRPVDLVVIFLGTNDVNFMTDDFAAMCVERLHRLARTSEAGPGNSAPQVLALAPPPFDGHEFGRWFRQFVTCEVLDLGDVTPYAVVGDDTCHLDEAGHAAVAVAVEERVRALLA